MEGIPWITIGQQNKITWEISAFTLITDIHFGVGLLERSEHWYKLFAPNIEWKQLPICITLYVEFIWVFVEGCAIIARDAQPSTN